MLLISSSWISLSRLLVIQTQRDHFFSYTGQENPTESVVLDFSLWYMYCLSGTHFRCVSFKLLCAMGTRKIIYYLLFDLDRFISVSGGLL